MDCCDEVYVDTETSELVCKRCGRVETIMGVAFDEYQFFDQAQKGQPPSTKKNNSTHLRKRLEKFKIFDAVNTTIKDGHMTRSGIRFLEALINDFHDGGKSVNYVCFLYDYFQAVPSDAWPRKEEILERLSSPPPKKPGKTLEGESKVQRVVEKKQTRGEALFEKNIGNLFRFHPFQCFKKIF